MSNLKLGRELKSYWNQILFQEKVGRPVVLDDLVNNFIKWYSKNMVEGRYTDIGEYHKPVEMRNFIEKMAVWYELRYPDYEINRMMLGSELESMDINQIMFSQNSYYDFSIDNGNYLSIPDWSSFYNAHTFVKSLPWKEKYFLTGPQYPSIVYLDNIKRTSHFHLSKKGTIIKSEIKLFGIEGINNYTLERKNIKEAVSILEDYHVKIPSDSEIYRAIWNYENQNYQKEEMLNCVMYRIIERGGNRIGARRGFLFAKEFHRNIDIPMQYGLDLSDPSIINFIQEYLEAGGSIDLECYSGYGNRCSKYEVLPIFTVKEVLETKKQKELSKRMQD